MLTLVVMQRDLYETVTLPLLVPFDKRESARKSDGTATFLSPEPAQPKPVRIFSADDFERDFPRLRGRLMPWEYRLLTAFRRWMDAQRRQDWLAVQHAEEDLKVAVQMRQQQNARLGASRRGDAYGKDIDLGHILRRHYDLPKGSEPEAIARHYGYSLGPRAASDIRQLLSEEISESLSSVRLVLWLSKEGFRMALYCPEVKTALYLFCLLGFVSGTGIGLCPKCGSLFKQSRPNQTYCSIQHREAHRVARWRAGKTKSRKKGRRDVTRKTR